MKRATYPKQQQSTLVLPYAVKHSPKKLVGKHVKNKNRAAIYAKNEKLLLFSLKHSTPVQMLKSGEKKKKKKKKKSQVLLSSLLSSEKALFLQHPQIKQKQKKKSVCTHKAPILYHNLCLKGSSCTKPSIYLKYQDASKFIINT